MRVQRGGEHIDYALSLADIRWSFYVIAAAVGLGVWLWRRDWALSLLAAYCVFALSVTLLDRVPRAARHWELRLFWSWKVPRLREEILMNILGFVPLGLLGAKLWRWRALYLAALFSLLIELGQLVTARGLFEFDDIVHNSLGAALGCCLYLGLSRLRNRLWKKGT